MLVGCSDDADEPDAAVTGGSGGRRPDASAGSGGGEPDVDASADLWACEVSSDCMIVPESCCGACGTPTRGDAIAIARNKASDWNAVACPGDLECPTCDAVIDPTLVARCSAQTCVLVDLQQHRATECTSDDQCRVRTPDCCECNGDTHEGRLLAVASENAYRDLVCDPQQACDGCAPVYPEEATATCQSGRCVITDERLPNGGDGDGDGAASCEVNGVVYASGTGGIDDPVSCNTCRCDDGQLTACTRIACPEPCPEGTENATSCGRCGPVDNCEVVRIGCHPTCAADLACEGMGCVDGVCRNLCG